MKAQILKIAGVKSEKEFYKKYPTEEAFMKAHGKAFKKAQIGAYIGGDTIANPKMLNFNALYDEADLTATGMTDAMRKAQAEKAAAAAKDSEGDSGASGGGMDISGIMSMFGGEGGGEGIGEIAAMAARHGADIPKAASGTNMNDWWSGMTTDTTTTVKPGFDINKYGIGAQTMGKLDSQPAPSNKTTGTPVDTSKENWMFKDNTTIPQVGSPVNKDYTGYEGPIGGGPDNNLSSKLGGLNKMLGPIGGIIEGIDALKAESAAADRARQSSELSSLQLKASTTRPEQRERKYVRPEDVVNTGEAFFPIYGVGTNVLARNGARLQEGGMIGGNPTEVQNTYGNGNSLYDDLGYIPLIDENQEKSFRQGGTLHQFQYGGYANSQDYYNQIIASGKSTGIMSGGDSTAKGAAGGGTDWGAISNVASGVGQEVMGGQNAGGQIGGEIGGAIGSAFGPAGQAVGNFVGTIAGNALDPYQRRMKNDMARTRRNVQNVAMNQIAPSIQAGYASHMKDGGWVSNDWTPQVIAKFGELDAQDYARFAHKDEFRAGGHLKSYTPPSERAMETFAMGGELETHWGGYAEPMSYNPYLPGTGETVMFRGKSHEEYSPNGETGIGITYGGNPVEVERGEPMVELEEGGVVDPETGEVQKSGVVFGNLKIPNQYLNLLGDPKAKDKKFKNYVADLSKEEEKQNKLISKSTDELNALDIKSSFDRLKLASLEANIKGGNMKLKDIADKKINAAGLQNAINDTAEEYGLVADDLARGKVKFDKEAMTTREARLGAAISKAKDGVTTTTEQTTFTPTFRSDKEALDAGYKKVGNEYIKVTQSTKKTTKEKKSAKAMDNIPKQSIDKATGLYGGVTPEEFKAFKDRNSWYNWEGFDPNDQNDVNDFAKAFNAKAAEIGSSARILSDELDSAKKPIPGGKTRFVGKQLTSASLNTEKEETPIGEFVIDTAKVEPIPDTKPIPYKRSPWIDFGNQVLDYIRPTDQEPFNYDQLMGEMYALSTNQLEPVQAQLYKPELGVPYDISYQDILNENQADYRAAQRMMGYNPAAQANLNANKYMANQKVLGEQFRANQAMKDKVYGENRNILNQAKLTNLGILDKQYERQSQAMSNTKATTQAALNSISDKYAKNRLENKTLGIYENLYKYRYDDKGRAINMNGIFQPNIPTVGSMTGTQRQVPVYKDGKIHHYQLEEYDPNNTTTETTTAPYQTPGIVAAKKSGGKVTKNNKNSSIVKAIKNL